MTNERHHGPDGVTPDRDGVRPDRDRVRPLRDRLGPADNDAIRRSSYDAETGRPAMPDGLEDPGPALPQLGGHAHPAKARQESRNGGSRVVAILGYVALAIVCIALTISTFVFVADPAELIRDQLVARTKAATGRDLVIRGNTRFTFYPSIGVAMSDVSLSPPPGMTGKPTIAMKRLDARLALMPLLKRRIVVQRLVLTQPAIDLHINQQGRKSWDFAATSHEPKQTALTSRSIRLAQVRDPARKTDALPAELQAFVKGSSAARKARSPLAMLDGLSLEDVRIVDGLLRYHDETTNTAQSLKAINLNIALKSLISPLRASGNVTWRGEKIDLTATIQSLKALLEERPVRIAAKVAARPVTASYDGGITLGANLNLNGRLRADSLSLRKLVLWLGTNLPAAKGFGVLSLSGQLKVRADKIDLSGANLGLDGATAMGDVGVTTGRARPLLRANLQLSKLDLNKYLPAEDGTAKPDAVLRVPRNRGGGAISGAGERSGKAGSAKRRPQVRGYSKRQSSGWSNAAIDLSALGLVDADVRLRVGKLFYRDLNASKAKLVVRLAAGKLTATLEDMQLYRGRGTAVIKIADDNRAADVSAQVNLSGISGLPFLRDAAKFERIDGRGNLRAEIAGRGNSEQQIMDSLLGNGSFTFTDGAIIGINIPKMIRTLQSGSISGFDQAKSEKTDFSALSGTFQITNGILRNKDLKLVSPLLRISGAGSLSLPARTLDYVVQPKVVASLEGQDAGGQGAASPLSGLEIPVRIRGSWDRPKISADFAAIAKDPDKALKAIQRIGKSFKGKNTNEVLDSLLGKGGSKKAKSLLNQFLR